MNKKSMSKFVSLRSKNGKIKYLSCNGKWSLLIRVGQYVIYFDWNCLYLKGLNIAISNYNGYWSLR